MGRGAAACRERPFGFPTDDTVTSRRYALRHGRHRQYHSADGRRHRGRGQTACRRRGRTPLINAPVLDDAIGARVFLKAETLQRTGSFKFRGAYNKIVLDSRRAARGRRGRLFERQSRARRGGGGDVCLACARPS